MDIKHKTFSSTISYKLYSKEINECKVMTKDREAKIKQCYLDPNTSDDEREKLKHELAKGHLKFAIQIANSYANLGMDLEDVIAEANIGLAKAANSFDWNRDIKFITHASHCIRGEVLNALNNNIRLIRLPMNVMHRVNKEYKQYYNNDNAELSDEISNLPSTTNLHKIIGDGSALLDVIKNNNAKNPDYDYEFDNLVDYLLSRLDKRSANIVSLLYGLKGEQKDMKEIADDLNLNIETIRLIKNKAILKLEKRIFLTLLK
jgi:RNA polymerase primary sigma factor